ncbi:MAG: DJ-1/PfpI family protein [Tissierellia bacterium]|nr:DJ-1/PfpI family protein [Tissierellia bacterium]
MARLAVLMAEGFEEIEALMVVDFCRRAGIRVDMLSIMDKMVVKSAHDVSVRCNKLIWDAKAKKYDGVYLPGGLPGANYLAQSKEVAKFLKKMEKDNKLIAAQCAAPLALDENDLLEEGKFTCYPGFEENLETQGRQDQALVKNGQVWTGMGPLLTPLMAFAIIEELAGKDKAQEIKKETLLGELKDSLCK